MYYGKRWKINGVVTGPIQRDITKNGRYEIMIERECAELQTIESIDWNNLKIERLNESENAVCLPDGYGFELENITYAHDTRTYTVTLQTSKQYWGDVTPYQAQIDTLTESNAEKDSRLAEMEEKLSSAEAQLTEIEEAYDAD